MQCKNSIEPGSKMFYFKLGGSGVFNAGPILKGAGGCREAAISGDAHGA